MSDCPYVLQWADSAGSYYVYDPCHCGRPYPCFFGQPIEIVLPYFIAGLLLGILPFLWFKVHVWKQTRKLTE